jgi:electron transport complex protein RnfG
VSGRGLPEGARVALTLTLAALVSGLAIAGAYRATLPAIRANQAAALERAVFEVLPGAERMERLEWRDGALAAAEDGAGGGAAGAGPAVYAGYGAGGERVGYAVPGEGAGFQDTIRLLFGYRPERRRIVGLAILESRETPGLGDRIYKDPEFVAEFADLAVEPRVELVKGGGEGPHQVDAITGATISSRAVVDIVNAAGAEWWERLAAGAADGGGEPGGGEGELGTGAEGESGVGPDGEPATGGGLPTAAGGGGDAGGR